MPDLKAREAHSEHETGDWADVTESVREATQARFEVVGTALTTVQTLAAAPLLIARWRANAHFRARNMRRHQWRRERWFGAAFQGELVAPQRPRIVWICSGIAETRLALQLSRELDAGDDGSDCEHHFALRDFPSIFDARVLPATVSASAFPFDYGPRVGEWLARWRPSLVVAVEKLWHLHLARACRARGIPLVAVHAHIDEKWKKLSPYERWVKQRTMEGYCALGFRYQEQIELWRPMCAPHAAVRQTGSLKFPLASTDAEGGHKAALAAWLAQIGTRPLVVAASVEPKEETLVCEAFAALRALTSPNEPSPVLLWAPRHLYRAEKVEAATRELGWTTSRRTHWPQESHAAGETPAPDVLILDTIGELMHCYAHARAVLVGGTFTGNGHNMFEPLAFGVPVVFGPRENTFFALEVAVCEAYGVGWRVQTSAEVGEFWHRAINDETWRHNFEARLPAFYAQARLGWEDTVAFLRASLRGLKASEALRQVG